VGRTILREPSTLPLAKFRLVEKSAPRAEIKLVLALVECMVVAARKASRPLPATNTQSRNYWKRYWGAKSAERKAVA
jgi:hypothetical protein